MEEKTAIQALDWTLPTLPFSAGSRERHGFEYIRCGTLSLHAALRYSKIERDVIARGIFKSTPDLNRKLMRYTREHKRTAKPINWKYVDVTRRIHAPHSAVTVH